MKVRENDHSKPNLHALMKNDGPLQYIELTSGQSSSNNISTRQNNCYEIALYLYGGGNSFIEKVSHPITDCSVHFIDKAKHCMVQPSQHARWGRLIFQPRKLLQDQPIPFTFFLQKGHSAQPYLKLDKATFHEIWALFLQMKDLSVATEKVYAREYILVYFNLLLLKLADAMAGEKKPVDLPEGHVLAHRFSQLVEEKFTTERSIEEYARLLHICPKYLNEICKRVYAFSPSQLINQRLSKHIQQLLSNTDLPLKEIAYRLRFNDQAYFSRFFKKMTNVSPGAFRNASRRGMEKQGLLQSNNEIEKLSFVQTKL
ncbi:MAG: AraC family transcriptional regulator [Bacteroidota bacterium]